MTVIMQSCVHVYKREMLCRSVVLHQCYGKSNPVQRHVTPVPSRVLWHAVSLFNSSTSSVRSCVSQRRGADLLVHTVRSHRLAVARPSTQPTVHQPISRDVIVSHDYKYVERRDGHTQTDGRHGVSDCRRQTSRNNIDCRWLADSSWLWRSRRNV